MIKNKQKEQRKKISKEITEAKNRSNKVLPLEAPHSAIYCCQIESFWVMVVVIVFIGDFLSWDGIYWWYYPIALSL